ncbi:hypothetical protein ASG35_01880 [Burkholderia sp. Leaf177]|nr:hypothetical protein ASG35_01880 [Burkholderia sp. Leaf177]
MTSESPEVIAAMPYEPSPEVTSVPLLMSVPLPAADLSSIAAEFAPLVLIEPGAAFTIVTAAEPLYMPSDSAPVVWIEPALVSELWPNPFVLPSDVMASNVSPLACSEPRFTTALESLSTTALPPFTLIPAPG